MIYSTNNFSLKTFRNRKSVFLRLRRIIHKNMNMTIKGILKSSEMEMIFSLQYGFLLPLLKCEEILSRSVSAHRMTSNSRDNILTNLEKSNVN